MTEDSRGLDPYEAVIADLKAKRDQIDQTIRTLQALRSTKGAGAGTPLTGVHVEPAFGAGMYLGMSIPDAAKKLLSIKKQALGNAEIAKELQAGGLVMKSSDPANTIGSVLTRRFNQIGDIVRVGRGIWGLAEWYPNRNFKKKPEKPGADNATPGEISEREPSEPERPSEPPHDAPSD